MRETGLSALLRRSTTAAVLVLAVVVSSLPVPALAANNDLLNDQVTPSSGTTATPFTFRVDYLGAAVSRVYVRLTRTDSTVMTFDLALVSGSDTDGTYSGSSTVASGSWSVSFRAEASAQNNPVENWGTLVVTPQPTPTPVPTPVPTPTPTPRPTPQPTVRPPTPRPTPAPTPRPGETPRPPGVTPPPTAAPEGPPPPATSAGGSVGPSATEGTLAGNPSSSPPGEDGNVPAEGSPDPNAEATSDTDSPAGVGRVVMLAVGGALAVSGAGYLGVLALRRRARLNDGPQER